MYKISSKTQKVLELIDKYINALDCAESPRFLIINDKLVEIIHRRFFDEYQRLMGCHASKDAFTNEFPLQLVDRKRLVCGGESLYIYNKMDIYAYFIESSSLYGYETCQSLQYIESFDSSFVQFNTEADNLDDFLNSVEQDFDISELWDFPYFVENMHNIYDCKDEYPIDIEVYKNNMIPAARKAYMEHKECRLFQKCFDYIRDISEFTSDVLYLCYETEHAWYLVLYYGSYNYYEEGYFYHLPPSTYLKRLFIDVALKELNRLYHFYSE